MGSTLSFPVIHKQSHSGGNTRLLYSTTAMHGWRFRMEDAHTAELSLDEGEENSNAFFAVYDGHGGATVAQYAGRNVHKRLVTEESYREKQYEQSLKRAFLGTDKDFLADTTLKDDGSGCTAVAALITGDGKNIYVANAGDSRSVLSVKGEVKPLSFDHKPENQTEKARIVAAGGFLDRGRANGRLALSRALGDFALKKKSALPPESQIITADPEVTSHDITEEDEFLVIACDGIWECLSSQNVIDFVRRKISEGNELSNIGEMLCDHCLAPDTVPGGGCRGCNSRWCEHCRPSDYDDDYVHERISIGCDNMTVIIVAILNGRTKEEWYTWVTERVKQNYGYNTPESLPALYDERRMVAFRAQQKQREERKEWQHKREQDKLNKELSSSVGGSAEVGTSGVSG